MKTDVFFVLASETARLAKRDLALNVKKALDESFEKNKGSRVVSVDVSADIVSSFQKALVTIVYDDCANPPVPAKAETPKASGK